MAKSIKKKFYFLECYNDGNTYKIGYLLKNGYNVPNDYNLDLAIYHTYDIDGNSIWYVVDCECGLSIACSLTKKTAIDIALEKLKSIDMDVYEQKKKQSIDKYLYPPDHKIFYLHDS